MHKIFIQRKLQLVKEGIYNVHTLIHAGDFFYVPELVHFIEEMLHRHRWTTATTTAAVIVSALYPPHCHRHVEAPPTLTPNTTINRHILGGTLHLPQY